MLNARDGRSCYGETIPEGARTAVASRLGLVDKSVERQVTSVSISHCHPMHMFYTPYASAITHCQPPYTPTPPTKTSHVYIFPKPPGTVNTFKHAPHGAKRLHEAGLAVGLPSNGRFMMHIASSGHSHLISHLSPLIIPAPISPSPRTATLPERPPRPRKFISLNCQLVRLYPCRPQKPRRRFVAFERESLLLLIYSSQHPLPTFLSIYPSPTTNLGTNTPSNRDLRTSSPCFMGR